MWLCHNLPSCNLKFPGMYVNSWLAKASPSKLTNSMSLWAVTHQSGIKKKKAKGGDQLSGFIFSLLHQESTMASTLTGVHLKREKIEEEETPWEQQEQLLPSEAEVILPDVPTVINHPVLIKTEKPEVFGCPPSPHQSFTRWDLCFLHKLIIKRRKQKDIVSLNNGVGEKVFCKLFIMSVGCPSMQESSCREPPRAQSELTVTESRLMELFQVCPVCSAPCSCSITREGNVISIRTECPLDHVIAWSDWTPATAGKTEKCFPEVTVPSVAPT